MDERAASNKHENGTFGSASELAGQAQEQLDELREHMAELSERVTGFIRERPGTALLVAAAAGYLIGRIVRS